VGCWRRPSKAPSLVDSPLGHRAARRVQPAVPGRPMEQRCRLAILADSLQMPRGVATFKPQVLYNSARSKESF
jgi:hypothetical protein